jgi:transporter family protein
MARVAAEMAALMITALHFSSWLWFAVLAIVTWGGAGVLQKISTNRISAESTLIWVIAGFLVLEPLLYTRSPFSTYSMRSVVFLILSGTLNGLAFWAMLTAMKCGGKASIVVPFTALYPLVIVIAAPILLHESVTLLQGFGILCGLGSVILLSV